ncbi:hypothetical protein ACS0TY_015669 [Phlomoides rotata]
MVNQLKLFGKVNSLDRTHKNYCPSVTQDVNAASLAHCPFFFPTPPLLSTKPIFSSLPPALFLFRFSPCGATAVQPQSTTPSTALPSSNYYPYLNQICKRSWIVNKTPSSLPLHRPTKQTSTKTLLLTNILFPYAYSSTHRSVGAHIRRKGKQN